MLRFSYRIVTQYLGGANGGLIEINQYRWGQALKTPNRRGVSKHKENTLAPGRL